MWALILCGILLYVLYKWITIKPNNFPPGPPMLPFIGSTPFIKVANIQFCMEELRGKYGPVIGVKFGRRNVILVSGTKTVLEVLKREEFNGRPKLPYVNMESNDLVGKGIMFTEGHFWTENRRFALKHLRDLGYGKSLMESNIMQEIEDMIKYNFKEKSQIVQIRGLFNPSIVIVIWSILARKILKRGDPVFKKLFFYLDQSFRDVRVTGNMLGIFPWLKYIAPEWSGYNRLMESQQYFKSFYRETIKEHQQSQKTENQDLVDFYLSDINKPNSSFDEQTLVCVMHDFFSAGGESTGNTLGFCCLYLVLYPHLQQEVYEEILNVLGDSYPTLQDKQRLPKVEAFLSKVIRSNTIAPITVAHETSVDTKLNGYDIPRETMTIISLWSIFQDRELWGDPEIFRPQRFLDEEGKYIKYNFFIPFGSGKRYCIGDTVAKSMMFLFFVRILQEFELKIPAGHDKPSTVPIPGATVVAKPFEVQFIKRQK